MIHSCTCNYCKVISISCVFLYAVFSGQPPLSPLTEGALGGVLGLSVIINVVLVIVVLVLLIKNRTTHGSVKSRSLSDHVKEREGGMHIEMNSNLSYTLRMSDSIVTKPSVVYGVTTSTELSDLKTYEYVKWSPVTVAIESLIRVCHIYNIICQSINETLIVQCHCAQKYLLNFCDTSNHQLINFYVYTKFAYLRKLLLLVTLWKYQGNNWILESDITLSKVRTFMRIDWSIVPPFLWSEPKFAGLVKHSTQ